MSGNIQMTKYLLSHKSDINLVDNEQHSVIHWTVVCGKIELIDVLFKAGAKPSTPDKHGAYPLHYAAQMCSPTLEPGTTRKELYYIIFSYIFRICISLELKKRKNVLDIYILDSCKRKVFNL